MTNAKNIDAALAELNEKLIASDQAFATAKMLIDMAVSISHGMSPDTVKICKLAAMAAVEYEDTYK